MARLSGAGLAGPPPQHTALPALLPASAGELQQQLKAAKRSTVVPYPRLRAHLEACCPADRRQALDAVLPSGAADPAALPPRVGVLGLCPGCRQYVHVRGMGGHKSKCGGGAQQ